MADMFRLDGKVCVVIGGGGSIGQAVALGYAQQGAKVAIASRDLKKLQDVAGKIKAETGADIEAFQVDVTSEESVVGLVNQVMLKFGTVDVLANCHGAGNPKEPADKFTLEAWNYLMDLNVKGLMLCCREFGKIMITNKAGKIINLSSVRGARATLWGGNLGYCASKGAVDMLTKALASEWAEHNILVNAVGPSLVATPAVIASRTAEQKAKYFANVPLKRAAEPMGSSWTVYFPRLAGV